MGITDMSAGIGLGLRERLGKRGELMKRKDRLIKEKDEIINRLEKELKLEKFYSDKFEKEKDSISLSYEEVSNWIEENGKYIEIGKAVEYVFGKYNSSIACATGHFEGEAEGFSISDIDQLVEGYRRKVSNEK